MTKPFSICVFCGSRFGKNQKYQETAEVIGQHIAEKGWQMVGIWRVVVTLLSSLYRFMVVVLLVSCEWFGLSVVNYYFRGAVSQTAHKNGAKVSFWAFNRLSYLFDVTGDWCDSQCPWASWNLWRQSLWCGCCRLDVCSQGAHIYYFQCLSWYVWSIVLLFLMLWKGGGGDVKQNPQWVQFKHKEIWFFFFFECLQLLDFLIGYSPPTSVLIFFLIFWGFKKITVSKSNFETVIFQFIA